MHIHFIKNYFYSFVKYLIVSHLFFIFISSSLYSSTTIKQGKYLSDISPELIYRRAYIDLRKDSIYMKNDYRNFADQIHLSLKISKSYEYVNEVVIEPILRSKKFNPKELEWVIAQAYSSFFVSNNIFFTIGKKLEFEGSGFLISPSDLLNQDKNIYDPLTQKEGKFFTRIGYQSDSISSSISFIPNRESELEDFSILSKTYFELFGIDTNFQYMFSRREKSTLGLSLNKFWNDFLETHVDSRYQTRQKDPAVNYSAKEPERQFSDKDINDSSFFVTSGIRVVLSPKRSIVLENIYKQSGLTSDQTQEFFDSEERISQTGEISSLDTIIGRNYVFLAYNDEDSIKKLKFTASALYNVLDHSSFINIDMDYKVFPLVTMGLSPMFNIGKKRTEFGEAYIKQVCYLTLKATF